MDTTAARTWTSVPVTTADRTVSQAWRKKERKIDRWTERGERERGWKGKNMIDRETEVHTVLGTTKINLANDPFPSR